MSKLSFIPKDFSTVWFFSMASKALQLVITVLLVRMLVVEDYASYTVFFTTSSTILGVTGQSVALAYVRYNTEKMSESGGSYKDSLVVFSQLLNMGCTALLLIGTYPLAELMGVSVYLMLASIVYGFFLGAIQLNIAFFQSRERYAKSGVIENAKQVVLLGALAIAIALGAGSLGSVVAAYCVSGLMCVLYSYALIAKSTREGGGGVLFALNSTEAHEFLAVSVWLILYSVTTQLYNQMNITMLSVFGVQSDVAEFGVASKYYNMLLVLLPSIKTVLRVRMSKAEMTHNTVKQRQFAVKWFKRTGVLFAAGIAVCAIGSAFVFPLLNGSQYNDAIPTFQILSLSAFSAYLFAPSSALIMSLNRYRLQFGIALVALAINLIGNMLLIPQMGSAGTAVATTLSQFVLNVLMTAAVFKAGSKER